MRYSTFNIHFLSYPSLLSYPSFLFILHFLSFNSLLSFTSSLILHFLTYPSRGLLSFTSPLIIHFFLSSTSSYRSILSYPSLPLLSFIFTLTLHEVSYPSHPLLSFTSSYPPLLLIVLLVLVFWKYQIFSGDFSIAFREPKRMLTFFHNYM